jgi:hypothetical protein
MAFKGKAPGSAAGDMSKRTEALRPVILLTPAEVQKARKMRRSGLEPSLIADALSKPLDEVEKALVQMRMPRPESTRGTLNITLAAHQIILRERKGNEPLWQTFDRIVDELLRLREAARSREPGTLRTGVGQRQRHESTPTLPGL